MNPILKNFLVFIGAFALGNLVNGLLIFIGGFVIPYPEGVDNSDTDAINAGMHLLEAKHFIFPLLAHSLGTFVAGFIVSRFCEVGSWIMIAIVAGVFLILGIIANTMIVGPNWFRWTDLLLSYVPMALIGGWLGMKAQKSKN